MSFPSLVPTARTFNPGNFPVKTFQAQDGDEVRLLYGDKRFGMRMELTYENITDSQAEEFLTHFHDMKGTFTLFSINDETKAGWEGTSSELDAADDSSWRYAQPPQLNSIYPGVSTVKVSLIAAFD